MNQLQINPVLGKPLTGISSKAATVTSSISENTTPLLSGELLIAGMSVSWLKYFFDIAKVVKQRSTCLRRQVGAVMVSDKRILATGYNGAPSGVKSCSDIGSCLRDKLGIPSGERHELCRANGTHAESNLISQCAKHGVKCEGSVVVCTTAPCSMCVAILINAGVKKVFYLEGYFNPTVDDIVSGDIDFQIIKVDPNVLK